MLFYCLLLSGYGCRTEIDVEDVIEEKECQEQVGVTSFELRGDSLCLLMDKGNVWRST